MLPFPLSVCNGWYQPRCELYHVRRGFEVGTDRAENQDLHCITFAGS